METGGGQPGARAGVAEDAADRPDPLGPAHGRCRPVVEAVRRDRDLVDPPAGGGGLRRDLELEAVAVPFELEIEQGLAPEGPDAAGDVGEVEVGDRIGEEGQHPVGEGVGPGQHPVGATGEPGAEDGIGGAGEQRREQLLVVLRTGWSGGVLHQHERSGRLGQPPTDPGAATGVVALLDQGEAGVGDPAQQLHGAVGRAAVHHDDLAGEGRGQGPLDDLAHRTHRVAARHDDAQAGLGDGRGHGERGPVGAAASEGGWYRLGSVADDPRPTSTPPHGARSGCAGRVGVPTALGSLATPRGRRRRAGRSWGSGRIGPERRGRRGQAARGVRAGDPAGDPLRPGRAAHLLPLPLRRHHLRAGRRRHDGHPGQRHQRRHRPRLHVGDHRRAGAGRGAGAARASGGCGRSRSCCGATSPPSPRSAPRPGCGGR